jgi:hypothetical protein
MTHRNDVEIKTHYETKKLCIENLIDHKKKTFFALFLRQISGVMTDNGDFEISSRYNSGSFFEFKGHVVEEVDGIYLKGHIEGKKDFKKYLTIITLLCILASPVYIIAWGIYGILFMSFILIDILIIWWYFKYGDALYKDILRKLN